MPQASSCARFRRTSAVALAVWTLAAPAGLSAQVVQERGPQLHWWHGLAAVGGYAFLTTFDDDIQDFVRGNRSETTDGIAGFTKRMGQPEVYATAGLGIIAAGLISGDREIQKAGIRVTSSLAAAGVFVTVAKFTAGRARPSVNGSEADDFRPFSGWTSAPSGHTAMAFSLATSLSEEIHNPWVTAGLYTLASGTALSRVNDNKHWFSDVVAGAAVGIVSARFMSGKLTVFGIRPPTIRPAPGGFAVAWQGSF